MFQAFPNYISCINGSTGSQAGSAYWRLKPVIIRCVQAYDAQAMQQHDLASLLTTEVQVLLSAQILEEEPQVEALQRSQTQLLTQLNALIQALRTVCTILELKLPLQSIAALPRIQAKVAAISAKLSTTSQRLAKIQAHMDKGQVRIS